MVVVCLGGCINRDVFQEHVGKLRGKVDNRTLMRFPVQKVWQDAMSKISHGIEVSVDLLLNFLLAETIEFVYLKASLLIFMRPTLLTRMLMSSLLIFYSIRS